MKHKSLKIGLTCFMGALIGTFIGLQFNSLLGFTVSIASGGLAGYLLWELKAVIQAIPKAFAWAKNEMKTSRMPEIKIPWHSIGIFFRFIIASVYMALIFVLTFTTIVYRFSLEKVFLSTKTGLKDMADHTPEFIILLAGLGGALLMMTAGLIHLDKEKDMNRAISRTIRKLFLYFNPLLLPFSTVYYAIVYFVKIFIALINVLIIAGKFSWIFSKKFLLLIHSDVRLLCLTDSALGAGIGYLMHSPVYGGLIGCISGLLNYWIISLRILKLKPKF